MEKPKYLMELWYVNYYVNLITLKKNLDYSMPNTNVYQMLNKIQNILLPMNLKKKKTEKIYLPTENLDLTDLNTVLLSVLLMILNVNPEELLIYNVQNLTLLVKYIQKKCNKEKMMKNSIKTVSTIVTKLVNKMLIVNFTKLILMNVKTLQLKVKYPNSSNLLMMPGLLYNSKKILTNVNQLLKKNTEVKDMLMIKKPIKFVNQKTLSIVSKLTNQLNHN